MGHVTLMPTNGLAAAVAARSCGGHNNCARARAGGRAARGRRDATAVPNVLSKAHRKCMQQLSAQRAASTINWQAALVAQPSLQPYGACAG